MGSRTASFKKRLRATIVMASLLGASAGFVAAISLAESQPAALASCDRGAPVKSAVCLFTNALQGRRR